MIKKTFVFVMLAGFLATVTPHIGAGEYTIDNPDKHFDEKIAKLVDQLGSDNYDERAAAREELLDVGEDARKALGKALKHPDPEIVSSAKAIIGQLNKLSNKVQFVIVCTDEKGRPLAGKTLSICVKGLGPEDQSRYGAEGSLNPSENKAMPRGGYAITFSRTVSINGRVSTDPLEMGREYEIKVSLPGYIPLKARKVQYQDGRVIMPARFIKWGKIRGIVVDAGKNNVPIPGCTVCSGLIANEVQTNNNGRFEIDRFRPGNGLYVRKEGYRQVHHKGAPKVIPGETTEVVIEMIEEKCLSGALAGKILKPDGTPLKNARFFVTTKVFKGENESTFDSIYYSARNKAVNSAEDGTFRVQVHPRKAEVFFNVPGYKRAYAGVVYIKPNETYTLRRPIKLKEGLTFKVRAVDEKGEPIPDAAIIVNRPGEEGISIPEHQVLPHKSNYLDHAQNQTPYSGDETETPSFPRWPRFGNTFYTSNNGIAIIGGMAEGKINLIADAEGFAASETKSIALKSNEKPPEIKVTLSRYGQIRLKVFDGESNKAISRDDFYCRVDENQNVCEVKPGEIKITERYSSAFEGDEIFVLQKLHSGKHLVVVQAKGYHSKCIPVVVKAGKTVDATVRLEPVGKGRLTGRIVPSQGNTLDNVGAVFVAASQRSGLSLSTRSVLRLRVDGHGRFKAENLKAGANYILVYNKKNYPIGVYYVLVKRKKETRVEIPLPALGDIA